MKIKKILSTKIIYLITSLLFTIFLFCYVNSDTGMNSVNPVKNTLTSEKTVTLTVPLKVNINSKYFVEGCPRNVKIKINGPAALVQATQNTQNFEVYIDLIGLHSGKYTVKLKESGINRGLIVNIIPKEITVRISKRESSFFPVQVRYDPTLINPGYAAGTASCNYNKVRIIGSSKMINEVTNVVANVTLPENTKNNVIQNVSLQALNENGIPVNVLIYPSVVRAVVPIYPATSSKKVNIHLIASGLGDSSKNYSLNTNTKSVTVVGTKQVIDHLNELDVPVSIVGISKTTSKNVVISAIQNGIVSISPSSINVNINVSNKNESSSLNSKSIDGSILSHSGDQVSKYIKKDSSTSINSSSIDKYISSSSRSKSSTHSQILSNTSNEK